MNESLEEINAAGLKKWPRPGRTYMRTRKTSDGGFTQERTELHPRSTGRSYKLMRLQRAKFLSNSVIVASIDNRARNPRDGYPYVRSIRTRQSKGKLIWQEWYIKPFRKKNKKVIDQMIEAYHMIAKVD